MANLLSTILSGNNHITFGPNSTWSSYLRVGGNGHSVSGNEYASVVTTNGNLHLDSGTSRATYINYYAGTSGIAFGNGASSVVAWMGPDGDLWKGGGDNSGTQYVYNSGTWAINISGNAATASSAPANGGNSDTVDGRHADYFYPASTDNGYSTGDIYGSGTHQRLWGTDSVQNLLAFRPPTSIEYSTDGVNWTATTATTGLWDNKMFGKWGGFNMAVGNNVGGWRYVRMTWVNFGYHFFSHFTLAHSTNGHSFNFVFQKSDLNGVFSGEAFRQNGISSWPGYTFTKHSNVSGWWDTRDIRFVFELNHNNDFPNNSISIGHIGLMGGYSGFTRLYDWDADRNMFFGGVIYAATGNSNNWNTAYGWGNHATAGYQAAATAITTSNIGSQSVSYADESGYSASSGSVEWTSVQNKPATFAPSAHNHDDRYYTESESDTRYAYKEGSSGTNFYANAYYQYEWTRIMGSGSKGIYWQEGDGAYWHIYPRNQADMRFRTGSGNGGIVGTVADETARGYIHWTTSNEIGFLSEDRNWVLRTYNRGVEVYGELRAPIFYDSTNTSYYLDPTSTTSIRTVGSWRADSSAWDGEFSGKIQYHSNHWYIQAADLFIYRNAGGSNVFTINQSGDAQANGSMRAPIFYDSNDTTYYLDPNAGTSLKIAGGIVSTAANGAVLLKHANSEANSWIFQENAANWGLFWFNAGGQSGQTIGSYTTVGAELFGMNNAVAGYNPNSAWSGTNADTRASWMLSNYSGYLWTQGTQYSETDMRAPIFYDSNNTGYYGNFASTSVMNAIRFGTSTNNATLYGNDDWGVRLNTDSGWIQFGPANSSWAHIYSNLPFYFNQDLYVNGTRVVLNSGTWGINITGNSNTTSQVVFSDLKGNFPSGAGGGYSFGSNHYSMGLDVGNGGWDGPHYRDLIIGYHTGVRIGAHYSGIRFYNNSPTTDANNDGNGDGGEALLMTIGGYVGTANQTDVVVNNNLFANVSMRAPIFYDSNDTGYYLDPNSESNLWRFTAASMTRNAMNYLSINSPYVTRSAQAVGHLNGIMGWGTTDLNTVFSNWGSGFFDSWGWPGQRPNDSASHWVGLQSMHYNHQNSTNGYGWQMVNGGDTNRWYLRQGWPNVGSWQEIITSGNIGSQSVSYATDSGSVDGIDSSRIVYGDGERKSSEGYSDMNRYNQASGFYFYNNPSNNPFGDWTNWINVMGNSWASNYGFQLAHQFHGEGFMVRRVTNGTFYSWRTIIDSGNIGSQSVNYSAITGQRGFDYLLIESHSDNTKGYRIHNTSGSSVSAMFTNSSNQLVIAAGALDQINLNKKVYVNGVALGVNVTPSATAGRIDASNDIVAYSSSDERLKYNITPIENAIDKVKSLTGVEFDWKPEYKHAHGYEGHDTGIIAQQVQEVIPSAVRTNDTGFLAVRYEKLIGLLIEANKELAARVEELEKKLG